MDSTTGKSPTAIDYSIEHLKADPAGSYGPWLAGLMGMTLVLGIITAQSIRYFTTFGIESQGMFAVVLLSLVLTFTHWFVIVDGAWTWFVLHFGDYRAFAAVPWQSWTSPIIGQVIVTNAQLFFAYRCYTLYHRRKIVLIGLLIGMLGSLALFAMVGVFVASDPFNYMRGRRFTIPAIVLNLGTDTAIAGLTLWKLGLGGGKAYSPNTDDVLQRLRNLTLEAAVPPAIFALINMTVYLAVGGENLAFVTFGVITPSLYVCSMLFTLNARRAIREKFDNPNDNGSLSGGFELSDVMGSSRRTRQTESRRTTIVFAPTTGPAFAPNASIGIVHERVEGSQERPALSRGRVSAGYDDEDDDEAPTTPGASHKELQVDLDRWEKNGLRLSRSRSTSTHPDRIPEPPPVSTLPHGYGEQRNA